MAFSYELIGSQLTFSFVFFGAFGSQVVVLTFLKLKQVTRYLLRITHLTSYVHLNFYYVLVH